MQEAAERGARVRVLLDDAVSPAAEAALRGRRGIELRKAAGELRAALGAAYLVIDRGEACLAGQPSGRLRITARPAGGPLQF